jgi:hypothetical protein
MKNRREFLTQAGALTMMSPLLPARLQSSPNARVGGSATPSQDVPDYLGWKPHFMPQGDGKGAWVVRPAMVQFLQYGAGKVWKHYFQIKGDGTMGYGLAQMDNVEVIFLGAYDDEGRHSKSVVAFSRDQGESWTRLRLRQQRPLHPPAAGTMAGLDSTGANRTPPS